MQTILYQADCLDVLPTLPANSIDLTFTSPPFKDEDVPGDYWFNYSLWMKEIYRVTSKVICIIQSATRLNDIVATYPPKRMMVWSKGIIKTAYRFNPIFIYQVSDQYKVNRYIYADAFGVQSIQNNWKVHKYQDPLILYETIIRMFKNCHTVLDPFMGSGTTGIVCAKTGQKFIGIDIDPAAYKTAREQIALATKEAICQNPSSLTATKSS